MRTETTGCGIKLIVAKGVKGDGVVWRGEWSATTTYSNIDAVSRGGSAWISKRSQNRGNDPLTDNGTWWDCMVEDSLARGYRDEAAQWANKSQRWAQHPENVPVEADKYSSYHWAMKAQHAAYAAEAFEDAAYASELLERLETMGGILI